MTHGQRRRAAREAARAARLCSFAKTITPDGATQSTHRCGRYVGHERRGIPHLVSGQEFREERRSAAA